MQTYKKEILRTYFKAIEIDLLDNEFRSRIVRASVALASSSIFDKLKSFYPMCFGDWRNLIDLKGEHNLKSKYLVSNWRKDIDK